MIRNDRRLIVWQKATELAEGIYRLVRELSDDERFGLEEMRRFDPVQEDLIMEVGKMLRAIRGKLESSEARELDPQFFTGEPDLSLKPES